MSHREIFINLVENGATLNEAFIEVVLQHPDSYEEVAQLLETWQEAIDAED